MKGGQVGRQGVLHGARCYEVDVCVGIIQTAQLAKLRVAELAQGVAVAAMDNLLVLMARLRHTLGQEVQRDDAKTLRGVADPFAVANQFRGGPVRRHDGQFANPLTGAVDALVDVAVAGIERPPGRRDAS